MNRITNNDLKQLCRVLNKMTGSPMDRFHMEPQPPNGQYYIDHPGHFYIDYAYGGASLERVPGPGIRTQVLGNIGHIPRRDLWNRIHAFIEGLEFTPHIELDK